MKNNKPAFDDYVNAVRRALTKHGRVVCLVGMMGCGKSAIGRILSQWLDCPLLDADKEIERAAGRSITEIFQQYGEDSFRKGELAVISRLLKQASHPAILSTGGGAFIQPETRSSLLEYGLCLWIKADFNVLWPRLQRKTNRPLLQQPNPQQVLKDLLVARDPFYEAAHIMVESDDIERDEMAMRILYALGDYLGVAYPILASDP
ncbi:MAG: shikimate kinase [Alphaproteobacteria bacterium]